MDEIPFGIIDGERGIADSQERLQSSAPPAWPDSQTQLSLKMGSVSLKLEKKKKDSCRVRLKMQL